MNIMKIFQSDFDLCLRRADCRFLEADAILLAVDSGCCFRSSCITHSPVILSWTQRNSLTFLYHLKCQQSGNIFEKY